MDPYTQKILEKAELRSKTLGVSSTGKFPLVEKEQVPESQSRKLNVTQKPDEMSPTSSSKIKRKYSVDKENVDVGIEISITTGPHVEVQVEVEEQDIDTESKHDNDGSKNEPAVVMRDSSRTRLQRLGALYSNTDLSSPIHRTEAKFHEGDTSSMHSDSSSQPSKRRLGKLVELADSIKSWEDDTSHPDYKRKLNGNAASSHATEARLEDTSRKFPQKSPSKKDLKNTKLKWDKNVLDSLEAQGFQRRESTTTKLSYEYKEVKETREGIKDYKKVKEAREEIKEGAREKQSQSQPSLEKSGAKDLKLSAIKSGIVSDRAAAFESKASSSSPIKQKDPAEMSLKERMMLFEKNKGKALLPKAAFAMAAPVGKVREAVKTSSGSAKAERIKDFPKTEVNVRDKVKALTSASSTISESKIKADIMKQRREDMEVLANRFNKQKEVVKSNDNTEIPIPPPPPPPKNDSEIKTNENKSNKRRSPGNYLNDVHSPEISEDTKRIKKSPANNVNRLYPTLSDIDIAESDETATLGSKSSINKTNEDDEESYMDSEENDSTGISNISLGQEIMKASQSESIRAAKAKLRYGEPPNEICSADSSTNSYETSDGSVAVEDYLDEALDEEENSDTNQEQVTPGRHSHGTTSSNSFSYQKHSRRYSQCQTITEESEDQGKEESTFKSPIKSALTINPTDDNGIVTLVHTVSFYRRQQNSNSNNSTPIRKIHREQQEVFMNRSQKNVQYDSDDENSSDQEESILVQEKIKKLLDEVCKQQQVIAQTSQALNLCAATIEFSGSTESVEGERHLLVATHRRQAALDEVQRLRVEGTIRPHGAPKEKGRLVVKEITVPLKQDYIRKLSTDTISGHHLVCLLKYNEHVLATKTVPTLPGLLAVKFPDVLQLNNVYADFKVTLEIYGMTAQREVLPHEVKYHINLNKKSGARTPKKKGHDSRLVMPMTQSPAGPNVVRTPALVQYGFAIFSLREIQRSTWTLTPVSGVSPLEGTVHMKVNCELSVSVEYKGFLTMFEDISGFGAWHRRWCHLNGHVLNYWKYPDDEKRKPPMGSIDLYTCYSSRVSTAPRDLCARLNTLLLECQRPAADGDVESFLILPKGKITIVRHLLSADTKEEREEWAAYFNKALTLLRAWGSNP